MENKDILEQERELRNDPLYALLRDDRPQPPRESRERVRRTLDRIERPPFARLGAFARRAPVATLCAMIGGAAFNIAAQVYQSSAFAAMGGQNDVVTLFTLDPVLAGLPACFIILISFCISSSVRVCPFSPNISWRFTPSKNIGSPFR